MWLVDGLTNALRMVWEVWWALVFGFALSAIVQAWVPRRRLERALGQFMLDLHTGQHAYTEMVVPSLVNQAEEIVLATDPWLIATGSGPAEVMTLAVFRGCARANDHST